MSRNNDNAVLRGLLRYDLDEEDEFLELGEAYDEQYRDKPQHYPRGRHTDMAQVIEPEMDW